MEFRILEEQELTNASGLSRFVFDNCLKNRMEFPQTSTYVEDYLKYENLLQMCQEEKLFVWGAFENEQLIAVSGMQSDGMITMLYVLPQFAGRGCGTNLLQIMRVYAKENLGLLKVTLNATPAWTAYYFAKQGFSFTNGKQNMRVPFVNMYAIYDKLQMYTKKRVPVKVFVLAILGCILFGIIFCCCFMVAYLF